MVGQTVSHYKILEKLGEGGMGIVYKAHDLTLHRTVALKFPPEVFTRDESSAARFLHEARMAASLLHPNVVVLYEVGDYEGHPFLALEYVDGHTLRHIVHRQGPLPMDTWLDVAIQVGEGLDAVHQRALIHRDIKSENILLDKEKKVKIVDCGLGARIAEAEGLAEELGIAGTTAYMSPEQARGDPLDQRSDIFSLGVVLYELLAGRVPFKADQPSALTYLIISADPPPLHTLRPDVPPAAETIVSRALQKSQDKRYQRVKDILRDLRKMRQDSGAAPMISAVARESSPGRSTQS